MRCRRLFVKLCELSMSTFQTVNHKELVWLLTVNPYLPFLLGYPTEEDLSCFADEGDDDFRAEFESEAVKTETKVSLKEEAKVTIKQDAEKEIKDR